MLSGRSPSNANIRPGARATRNANKRCGAWSDVSDDNHLDQNGQGSSCLYGVPSGAASSVLEDAESGSGWDARSRRGHSDGLGDRSLSGRAPTILSAAAPPNKDGVVVTRGGEVLTLDSGGRCINSEGKRCDHYGRLTKARGVKGANSSQRRGWRRDDDGELRLAAGRRQHGVPSELVWYR